MRKMFMGLIATAAIVTSMSQAALAQPKHARHAQAIETTRNAYGSSSYEERGLAPWNSSVHAGNATELLDDPRSAVNGN